MKTRITQTIVFFSLLAIATGLTQLFSSCNQSNASSPITSNHRVSEQVSSELPQLFARTGELSKTDEWYKTMEVVENIQLKLESQPNDVKSKIKLSQIYMNEARITGEHGHYYPAIVTILDDVLSTKDIDDEAQFQALSLKSSVLLSLHEFESAKILAEEAVVLNPYNAQIYGALVDANVELGDYPTAVKMAEKMMELRPDLLSYSRASYLREIHGDMEGAIEAMDLAVASGFPGNENTAWSRLTLGNLYESSGRLTEAELQYKSALDERPDYPFAVAALANIELKKGNKEDAEMLLKQAASIIPEVSFYSDLASIYQETGRIELANKTIQEVMDMMADDEAHGHKMDLEYAKVHLHLTHKYDSALERALIEYEARPANIDVNKILAKIYYKLGDLGSAESHMAMAMTTNSQAYDLLTVAGLIQAKNGNSKEAKALIKKSQEINPYQNDQFALEARTVISI